MTPETGALQQSERLFDTTIPMEAGHWTPRVAAAHQPYVYDIEDSEAAVRGLVEVKPTVVTSDRPLVSVAAREPGARLRIVPFQEPDTGRYMNVLADVRVELAPELIEALARKVEANRRHFPREATLADTFGVPGLYVRLDCFLNAAGEGAKAPREQAWSERQRASVSLSICEFDDQPAFVGSFAHAGFDEGFLPFRRLQDELRALGRPLRLAEDAQDPDFYTLDNYPHDDRLWLSDTRDGESSGSSAVVVRARRRVPGSQRFLERWNAASIFPGSAFRDYKGVLGLPRTVDPELGLGVLVRDHEAAREVISRAHRRGLPAVVAKGLYSARKESAMAVWPGSKVPASYYRLNQLSRIRCGRYDGQDLAQPLVLQPAYTPPTFANLGITLTTGDAEAVRRHWYRLRSGAAATGDEVFAHLPAPGNERRFHGLFRLYFVYLPSENRGARTRARFAGGLLQGCTTPMAIHGSNGALTVWVQAMEPEAWPNAECLTAPVEPGSVAHTGNAHRPNRHHQDDGGPWVDVARLPRFAPTAPAAPTSLNDVGFDADADPSQASAERSQAG